MSTVSNVCHFAANNRATTAVCLLAGAVVGFLANHFYFYVPGAIAIGVAVAAIGLWVASKGRSLFGRVEVVPPKDQVEPEPEIEPSNPEPKRSMAQKFVSMARKYVPYLADDLTGEINEIVSDAKTAEAVRNAARHASVPYNFYRQIDNLVKKGELSPANAFSVLRAYDHAKGLTNKVTEKLHASEATYQFYQTYRGVLHETATYEAELKKLYPKEAFRVRNLMTYQSARAVSNGKLRDKSEALRKNTTVCTPEPLTKKGPGKMPKPEVWAMTTFAAAQRLVGEGFRPAVLNMANESHPGGGFTTGAFAQEECLCGLSNMYEALEFAKINGLYPLGVAGVVCTPGVTFFRDDKHKMLDKPFEVDVIGSAAYICEGGSKNRPDSDYDYETGTMDKMRSMFRAAAQRSDSLLLSAFGCGAFKNKPDVICQLYKRVLAEPEFQGCFRKVVFGIIDDRNGAGNLAAFQRAFQE